MSHAHTYAPGEKTSTDENFPVASYLIAKPYRTAIMAYYRFARASDDVADHPSLSPDEKVRQLDAFEATLLGKNDAVADAIPLREACEAGGFSTRHGTDLLIAFRQDALKPRYENWDELLHYCMFSAAPVGRFVMQVHGENEAHWPASDAICSALQIINHLQDCAADFTRLNRIYLPRDLMEKHRVTPADLAAPHASPGLRAVMAELVARTQTLMKTGVLSPHLRDFRLAVEIRTIEQLAQRLLALLAVRDPLSEKVHLSKMQMLGVMLRAALAVTRHRALSRKA